MRLLLALGRPQLHDDATPRIGRRRVDEQARDAHPVRALEGHDRLRGEHEVGSARPPRSPVRERQRVESESLSAIRSPPRAP